MPFLNVRGAGNPLSQHGRRRHRLRRAHHGSTGRFLIQISCGTDHLPDPLTTLIIVTVAESWLSTVASTVGMILSRPAPEAERAEHPDHLRSEHPNMTGERSKSPYQRFEEECQRA